MDIDARSPVRHLMAPEPVSVDEKLTLRSLAAVLDLAAIGVVFVRRADGSPGIVSERDVVHALAEGADPDAVWAADVMTEDLLVADADERVIDVALRLVAENIRHAAIIEQGALVGVVSARDLLQVVTDDLLEAWT